MNCHICQSEKLYKFLSLGPMPLANSYLREDQLNLPEPYYPLDVYFCDNCGLVQLGETVSPEILFKDYAYITGTSQTRKTHFSWLVEQAIQQSKPPKGSLIVDIGSNDGTLLQNFEGYNTLGIEPATNIVALATSQGIETLNDFFGVEVAKKIRKDKGEAHIILGTNVFAHVANLDDFMQGITHLLSKDGVFIIEVPYLLDLLNKLEFDTIYHEHLHYFSIRPLATLFKKFGMGIVKVDRTEIDGGSICVYTQKSVDMSAPIEQVIGLDSLEEFAQSVVKVKEELVTLLRELKSQGAKISGYTAPAKGNVLLNYCKIGTDILDYTIDVTPFKQGHYTPGMHIPIYPEQHFHELPPDYALLLAWNFEEEILRKEKQWMNEGGKFIIPIPKPRIVGS